MRSKFDVKNNFYISTAIHLKKYRDSWSIEHLHSAFFIYGQEYDDKNVLSLLFFSKKNSSWKF